MENFAESSVVLPKACPGCKAEIRSGSEYCYNCGNKIGIVDGHASEVVRGSDKTSSSTNGSLQNGPGVNPGADQRRRPGTRSRRPRSSEPVQVVWKREEDVGLRFLVFTIGAAVLAILLIGIAYYLK